MVRMVGAVAVRERMLHNIAFGLVRLRQIVRSWHLLIVLLSFYAPLYGQQLITLSANKKYLVNSFTNQPVFLTGDAPQILVEEISDADAITYLADRAARGFNALWVYPVDRADQSNPQHDFYGNDPWSGGADFTNENSTYWTRVDTILTEAQNYGITLFLDPGFVGLNSGANYYLTSWDSSSDAVLQAYAAFLGNRYKNYPNIVWSLGGDADPATVSYTKLGTFATALAAADPNHLITLEACRWCSPANQSTYDAYGGSVPSFMNLNWVYNTQSTVVAGCQAGYSHAATIPPLMGEDWYELEHSMTSFQIRQEGYWEVLSGCYLGRLFGNNSIWTFNSPNSENPGGPSWQSQLGSAGSVGQQYLGQLMRSREHWLMAPDTTNSVLTAGYGSGATLSVAARSTDGQTIIAYLSDGNATTKTIDMSKITSTTSTANAWWYDPHSSTSTLIGAFPNSGTQNFAAPDGNDWMLVIDDASVGLPAPGSSGPAPPTGLKAVVN